MEIQLTLHGRKRKDAADCVGEAVNTAPVYLRAPTHNYDIAGIILDKHGVLTIGDFDGALPKVLAALQKAGFYTPEEAETPETEPEALPPPEAEPEPPAVPEAQALTEPEAEPTAIPEAVPETPAPPDEGQEPPASPGTTPAEPEAETEEEPPAEPAEATLIEPTVDIPPEPAVETPLDEDTPGEAEALPEEDAPGKPEESHEPEEEPPSDSEQTDRVVIQMPLTGFPPEKIDNLRRLVASKETLIKKAIGIEAIPIIEDSETLDFPWVPAGARSDEIHAYAQLVSRLYSMATAQQRVLAVEQKVPNERYAFRCFLLRLGFIGEEYAVARKILLRNLEGNGSHKSGNGKPPAPKEKPAPAPASVEAIITTVPAPTQEDAASVPAQDPAPKSRFLKKLAGGLKMLLLA